MTLGLISKSSAIFVTGPCEFSASCIVESLNFLLYFGLLMGPHFNDMYFNLELVYSLYHLV